MQIVSGTKSQFVESGGVVAPKVQHKPAMTAVEKTQETPWVNWTVMGEDATDDDIDLPFNDDDFLPKPRTCYCCKGTDFWESANQDDHWICRKCHAPITPELERAKP
jgi:hypothetical protein